MFEKDTYFTNPESSQEDFRVCVYCASSPHIDERFFRAAQQLGKLFAENNFTCIDGAGKAGLMGALNDSILAHGGNIIGVIPQFMVDSGWHHSNLTKTIVTETMHERKQTMAQLSNAIVALPGGVGTLEELLEIVTWKQLGLYKSPIVIANIDNYYSPLLEMFEKMIGENFMAAAYREMWQIAASPEEVVECLKKKTSWNFKLSKYDKKEL